MHLSKLLLDKGFDVVGIDNLNDYYDVSLKEDRLKVLKLNQGFSFEKIDISDYEKLKALFDVNGFKKVIHLAAQAGIRYSLKNPHVYGSSNLIGFLNILECSRHAKLEHLIFASSSSVYGSNTQIPFTESQNTDHPVSLYAATKKANEAMAHSYAHLYQIPITGLRFFTVYGPWGRPDMAPMLFTKTILEGRPIDIFNQGDMYRDFTYIDDIIESVFRVMNQPAESNKMYSTSAPDSATSAAPYRIYNIGNHKPVKLLDFISILEKELGVEAKKNYLPMQPGEVHTTYADVSALQEKINFVPQTELAEGVRRLIQWYRSYY